MKSIFWFFILQIFSWRLLHICRLSLARLMLYCLICHSSPKSWMKHFISNVKKDTSSVLSCYPIFYSRSAIHSPSTATSIIITSIRPNPMFYLLGYVEVLRKNRAILIFENLSYFVGLVFQPVEFSKKPKIKEMKPLWILGVQKKLFEWCSFNNILLKPFLRRYKVFKLWFFYFSPEIYLIFLMGWIF